MKNLTIKDIARICEVSTSTVSRAMNDDPGINKETKERILQTMNEYHYVPNNAARNLKMIESNTVAILVKGIENQFFHSMLKDFVDELKYRGYTFTINAVNEDQNEVAVAAELVKEKKLKGIIFLGGLAGASQEELSFINIPYVRCTGASVPGKSVWTGASISIDDEAASYKAVDYLCKKGHKKIAIICSREKDQSIGRLRLNGYKRALADNGIDEDSTLIRYTEIGTEPYSIANGYNKAKELLDRKIDFTALFAVSDMIAIGAYKAIQESGKKIPDDYSVVGFDGLEITRFLHPSLTTVTQPCKDMVHSAVEELAKAIEEKSFDQQVFFEAVLTERDSVKNI